MIVPRCFSAKCTSTIIIHQHTKAICQDTIYTLNNANTLRWHINMILVARFMNNPLQHVFRDMHYRCWNALPFLHYRQKSYAWGARLPYYCCGIPVVEAWVVSSIVWQQYLSVINSRLPWCNKLPLHTTHVYAYSPCTYLPVDMP